METGATPLLRCEPPLVVGIKVRTFAPVLVFVETILCHAWTTLAEADGFDAEIVAGGMERFPDTLKPESVFARLRPEILQRHFVAHELRAVKIHRATQFHAVQ